MSKVDLEEGQTIEFEEKIAQQFSKKVVGMYNSSGGAIYLGISDDKEIKGIKINTRLKERILDICSNCKDPVIVKFREEKRHELDVLVVIVPKGKNLPCRNSNGTAFIRTGAITREATTKEIQDMVKSCGYICFEKQPVLDSSLKDIDENKIKAFLIKTGKTIPDQSISQILMNLNGAVKDNGRIVPTTTGLLFFGKNPQKFISHSRIKISRFKGFTTVKFIDKADLTGTISEMLEEAQKFIKRNMRNAIDIVGFERIEMPEYPLEAVREAIVNAVAHREYAIDTSPTQIQVFDDRIEVKNPGVPSISIEELEGTHMPRNETICKLLDDIGFMEGYGTGIARMKESMTKHGLKEPRLEYNEGFFTVTFLGPKEDIMKLIKPIRTNLKEIGLNDRQIKALAYIKDQGIISHKEYCAYFEVANFTAYKELKELVEKGFVEQEGKGPDSWYKLLIE